MVLAPPKMENPRNLLLFFWQILDLARINIDLLKNTMAFEFKVGSPEKCTNFIRQAITDKLLIEYPDEEEVELCSELKQEFERWQQDGTIRSYRIRDLLNKSWRTPIDLGENATFTVLLNDLSDSTVQDKASKMLASKASIETQDFSSYISGTVLHRQDDDQEIALPFRIDCKNRQIIHQCYEYDHLRKAQKKFCVHLTKVIMKLAKDSQKCTQLLHDIVYNKAQWQF